MFALIISANYQHNLCVMVNSRYLDYECFQIMVMGLVTLELYKTSRPNECSFFFFFKESPVAAVVVPVVLVIVLAVCGAVVALYIR